MAKLTQTSDQVATARSFRQDYEFDPNSDVAQARVVRLVGTGKRVLELGCAVGNMSRALHDRGCQVVGVEIDAQATALASEFCERVIVSDLNQLDLAQELTGDSFDVIVATDVLEHLKDPLAILLNVKKLLRPDGYFVVSLHNVAHGALLDGQFRYTELGLLGATQLHIYTRETMEELFENAGLAIGYLERVERKTEGSEVVWDKMSIPADLLEMLSQNPEALTYQFIVMAYPLARSDLRFIQQRMHGLVKAKEEAESCTRALAMECEAARHQVILLTDQIAAGQQRTHALAEQELARLRETLAEQMEDSQAMEKQVQAASAREAELRSKLFDAHDQLIRRDDKCIRLQTDLNHAQDKIQWIEVSKAWQQVQWFWRTRQRVKQIFFS